MQEELYMHSFSGPGKYKGIGGDSMDRKHGDTFGEGENIVSGTECTGLMPALPYTMEEDRSSSELYRIHSAHKRGKKRRTK